MTVTPRIILLAYLILPLRADVAPLSLLDSPAANSFPIVSQGETTAILSDPADFKVVEIVSQCLARDIEAVSGKKPKRKKTPEISSAIIIGTIGKSKLIDSLIASGKINVSAIKGKWESYLIATVSDPFPDLAQGLVIVGSDRRGTAFGVFELSETIGVSPWIWWADVTPLHRDHILLSFGTCIHGSPSVKYRGIFINDEDWGLQPWAAKTLEPETKDIGPKTYAKVCELLLRLKANYLWPAMHPSTRAFNFYPKNKLIADDYAIVMGSSHAEPMLRNNVDEWDHDKHDLWNYETNRHGILSYWETRVKENGRYENNFTLGMRGIHDSGMPGGGTIDDKVTRLQRVIEDQRALLTKHVNPNIKKVPQIFVPYKEVLTLYQHGLKVPNDVTLVWPDDNHGYIRRLSNETEQNRAGGSGIYYHISYWGAPEDYLWLCSTPPALIWEEMHKAYENGARDVWVVNIGDIKPHEIGMEFFLRMAWDAKKWDESAQPTYLAEWAERNFGKEKSLAIADVLGEYYRLNSTRKPEHLLRATFTHNEQNTRLKRFAALVKKTNTLYQTIAKSQKNAFYQLAVYPIRCSALMNQKCFGKNPEKAHAQIQTETDYYNTQLSGGKWNHILSANPRGREVFKKETKSKTPPPPPHAVLTLNASQATRITSGTHIAWKAIQGLGHSGNSITLLPTTQEIPLSAVIEYDFTTTKEGTAKFFIHCIPTHAIHSGRKLRYSVGIDSKKNTIVNIDTQEFSRPWATNVLRASAIGTIEAIIPKGKHTLKLRPLDPGVVFDQIVFDLGGLQHPSPPPKKPSSSKGQ